MGRPLYIGHRLWKYEVDVYNSSYLSTVGSFWHFLKWYKCNLLNKSRSTDHMIHQIKSSLIFFCRYVFFIITYISMESVFAISVSQMSTDIVVIPVWSFPHSWLITGFVTRMQHVEQKLSVYVMFGRSLFVYFSRFSFGNWVVYPSTYGFWFPNWNLQTFLSPGEIKTFSYFNNIFGISWWKPINIDKPADLPLL